MTPEQHTGSQTEEESAEKKKSLYDYFIAIALGLMAIGQWSDTKDIAIEAWQLTMSNFTHKYEYESLEHINVGSNLNYIANYMGQPKLIKKSKFHENLSFAYFLEEKFILTLIIESDRVNGYTITSLVDDFVPNQLLSKEKQQNVGTIADKYVNFQDFTLDYNNIEYLLVSEQLGKEKLYVNQYFGHVGYHRSGDALNTKIRGIYDQLNLDEENPAVLAEVKQLTTKVTNNFYGVGEVNLSVIADSVLTNFEYSLYYKK